MLQVLLPHDGARVTADWSLPAEVFAFLEPRIRGLSVVELGSGRGSSRLASLCASLVSVEHDVHYVETYPADAGRVIHAPIDPAAGWYARAALADLPGRIDAVIVDGPPGSIGRCGLMSHLDLFPDVPFLFADTHRAPERELAIGYWQMRRNSALSLHALLDGRGFATVGWGWA